MHNHQVFTNLANGDVSTCVSFQSVSFGCAVLVYWFVICVAVTDQSYRSQINWQVVTAVNLRRELMAELYGNVLILFVSPWIFQPLSASEADSFCSVISLWGTSGPTMITPGYSRSLFLNLLKETVWDRCCFSLVWRWIKYWPCWRRTTSERMRFERLHISACFLCAVWKSSTVTDFPKLILDL